LAALVAGRMKNREPETGNVKRANGVGWCIAQFLIPGFLFAVFHFLLQGKSERLLGV